MSQTPNLTLINKDDPLIGQQWKTIFLLKGGVYGHCRNNDFIFKVINKTNQTTSVFRNTYRISGHEIHKRAPFPIKGRETDPEGLCGLRHGPSPWVLDLPSCLFYLLVCFHALRVRGAAWTGWSLIELAGGACKKKRRVRARSDHVISISSGEVNKRFSQQSVMQSLVGEAGCGAAAQLRTSRAAVWTLWIFPRRHEPDLRRSASVLPRCL